jgi:Domain of unknown function (DUF3854)
MTAPAPNAERIPPSWGGLLTEADYAALAESWISREIADAAMLRRVSTEEGREIVGQKGSRDCAGILIPYYWPGESAPFAYRVRRDKPDYTFDKDGKAKPDRKYLSAPGSANRLYIPPGVTLQQLADAKIPIVLVEGEKKALALWRLANHETKTPRFIPLAIAGVWNWRGVVGKTTGPKGERVDVKGPIADLARIEWKGRVVFVVFDANVRTNESVKWARKGIARELATRHADVKFVNLPEDCGVNGIDDLLATWGPVRVLKLFDHAEAGTHLTIVAPPQFQSRPTGMFRVTRKGEALSEIQLTNYSAAVITNIQLDDGVESKREFEIEAELMGRKSSFNISAAAFARMDWPIELMGVAALTYPNQREYARAAIQSSSLGAEERCIYTHTGWRKLNDQWVFLHSGGAIGADGPVAGVNVRLSGAMSRFDLTQLGADDLASAVTASLRLLKLAPASISFPLLAAVFRAVFGEADFSLHVAGDTGTFKTELAALHQRFFGVGMDRLHLPGSWSSTGNSLEILSFHGKNALVVIDDFAPQGSATDIARYHSAADRVFRAAGNHAGRGRLDSTAKLREPKPPRALILSTGEDIPRGQSVRARLMILEPPKGAIKPGALADCQLDAQLGLYAHAMAGFLQWFAGRHEDVRATFDRIVSEFRSRALQDAGHARTPDIVANLQAAFEVLLVFAVHVGAIDGIEQGRLSEQCWQALSEAAKAQSKHQAATEPTARYLTVLRSLLASGKAHFAGRDGGMPDHQAGACGWRRDGDRWLAMGERIGWLDPEDVYLEPAATYRAVQAAATAAGEAVPVSEQTLIKRLRDKGLLASTEPKRETLTVRRTLEGVSRSVLHLSRALVLPQDPDHEATNVG